MNEIYLDAAQPNLNYNMATGYSFVTGLEKRSPMNPQHRQSATDNNSDPISRMVVGGPHGGQQDNCNYTSYLPANPMWMTGVTTQPTKWRPTNDHQRAGRHPAI